jgi:two-component system chemotaxis response regulator CheY
MRVMLIDDSKTMRNIAKAVLKDLGHVDIVEASNGQDAMSRVGAVNPELILVDWNTPGMDGLTFVKRFRQVDKTTPVIMLAAETGRARVIEAIEAGVNNYVVKPFTPEMLSQRIDETLSRSTSTG